MAEDATSRPCPICGRPASPTERPFCSRRCRMIDLNRWLSGVYAVPAEDDDEAPEPENPPQDRE